MRSSSIARSIAFVAALSGIAVAKTPAQNVSHNRHPNIAAAQDLSARAFERLDAAQKANEFDMNGHAQKAKDALKLANDEMKLAAEAANK